MSEKSKETEINVGIIGAGRWGPNLIGSFSRLDGVKISCVVDLNKEALKNLHRKFPTLKTTTSVKELLLDQSINAVAVCTPVETHIPLVDAVLEAGKHVFVEKPFGKEPSQCRRLCKIANQKELCIMVGHVFLFNSSVIELKKIVNSGELGDLLHIEAHRTNLGPVRKDVNAVWDLTSHDLSIFDFILDELPVEVSCLGSRQLDPENEDTAYTTFKYPNGILAHAHASWLNPRKIRQITVIGSKKMALWDDLNFESPITIYDCSIGLDQSYYSDSFASHRLSYNRGDVLLPFISSNEPLMEELKHFIEVIQGQRKNRSSGGYGIHVAESLKASDESLLQNGKFVEVKR